MNWIEGGVWRNESRILFSKSVPPKSSVKKAIYEARMLAVQLLRNLRLSDAKQIQSSTNKTKKQRRHRRILNEIDTLNLLTLEARSEYSMQQDCRQSREPTRPLRMIVWCKPLSDGAFHLNQTQLERSRSRSSRFEEFGRRNEGHELKEKETNLHTATPITKIKRYTV